VGKGTKVVLAGQAMEARGTDRRGAPSQTSSLSLPVHLRRVQPRHAQLPGGGLWARGPHLRVPDEEEGVRMANDSRVWARFLHVRETPLGRSVWPTPCRQGW